MLQLASLKPLNPAKSSVFFKGIAANAQTITTAVYYMRV